MVRWLFILCAICTLSACTKTELNPFNTPGNESLNLIFSDTLSVIVNTVTEHELRTDELPRNVIGSMDEPVFGTSHASFYTQLRLTTNNLNFGNNLTADSAVLTLRYAGSYGDITVPQDIYVYRVDQAFNTADQYFSNKSLNVLPTPLGSILNFTPNVTDSVHVGSSLQSPHLRIKLNQSFADELIQQSNGGNFATNDAFKNFLKGFYVTADTTKPGKGVFYIDPLASLSKLTLYYKVADTSKAFDFPIDNQTATIASFRHNYTGSVVANQLTGNNPSGEPVVYIQSMTGVKAKVEIPYLKELGKILINKAELVITQVEDPGGLDKIFTPPAQLIVNRDSAGRNDFILDQTHTSAYFGGVAKAFQNADGKTVNQYRFNLARHYQQISNGEIEDNGIYILTFPSNQIGDRLIIGGTGHSHSSVKFNITYTKIQ